MHGASSSCTRRKDQGWTSTSGMLFLVALGGTFHTNAIFLAFSCNEYPLELVVKAVTDDRTVCKTRSRANDGGCDAVHSLHPHDHCTVQTHIVMATICLPLFLTQSPGRQGPRYSLIDIPPILSPRYSSINIFSAIFYPRYSTLSTQPNTQFNTLT